VNSHLPDDTPLADWMFDAEDAISARVPAAPVFDRYKEFFEEAVPTLASASLVLPDPTMIVAQVTAPAASGRALPAGPRDRAKALMDALHDQRRRPPFYRDFGGTAPLPDDNPNFVRGLAVEVHAGARTETVYRLGTDLALRGRVVARVEVDLLAPNDIWVSPASRARIEQSRSEFTARLVEAWRSVDRSDLGSAAGLIVRHHPDRDEDNTWSNWLGAITGRPAWSRVHWGHEPPLVSWRPTAIASVSDDALPTATRFELVAATRGVPALSRPD
jgi:hypothetical protein